MKKVNLVNDENPKVILVGDDWNPVLKEESFGIFLENKGIFAWMYKDLKGIPLELCVHQISLVLGAQPVWRRSYRMNKNYAVKVNEEIEKMWEASIISKVETSDWV